MDITEIRLLLKQFGKTAYGRTIFMIAYFVPITLFFTFVILAVMSLIMTSTVLFMASVGVLVIFVPFFMAAHAYYYRELRDYAAHFQSSDHARVRRFLNNR